MEEKQETSDARHLTSDQREDILGDLKGSTAGPPVSIVAAASDKEAVGYESEIASVLQDMGCKVEIENVKANTPSEAIPTGVEMTIKEETVRPIHANRIMCAFRRAGVAVVTRINPRRRKNDTLYITVGANDPPP
jgi:formylmethanofuran:tetrahydromethanopterin formyltransferase